MKKNIYYRATAQRTNHIKVFILSLVLMLCSYPRLIIEVFIKLNMGERYFGIMSAMTVAAILFGLPFYYDHSGYNGWQFIASHIVWYCFLALYVFFSIQRYIEMRRTPGVFDFSRFSLSQGVIRPRIYAFWESVLGHMPNPRFRAIWLDGLPFLVGGIVLLGIYGPLGILLIACSMIYSVSFMGAYWIGDNIIMDLIDEMICNEETENIVVHDKGPEDTKGLEYFLTKPKAVHSRQRLADNMIEDDGRGEQAAVVF